MAVALKIRVCDLGTEFSAHTLVFGGALQAAGAVAARHFQTLTNAFYNFLVGIFFNFHDLFRPLLIFVLV